MANIGYIRVSSKEQHTDRQHAAFEAAGITLDRIYEEKISGKDANRPALQAMFEYIRENDIVYIESISRLGRSMKDLLEIIDILEHKKVQLKSLKESIIDTTTPQGKLIFGIFSALSEFERECIRERQREGIDLCIAQGRPYGRPSAQISNTFAANYRKWKAGKIKAVDFMRLEELPKSTFYKLVRRFESDKKAKHENYIRTQKRRSESL